MSRIIGIFFSLVDELIGYLFFGDIVKKFVFLKEEEIIQFVHGKIFIKFGQAIIIIFIFSQS